MAARSDRDARRVDAFKKDLRNKIKPEIAYRWKVFGTQLIGHQVTNSFAPTHKKSCEDCYQELLQHFLSSNPYWKEIFDALEGISKRNLKRRLERDYNARQKVNLDVRTLSNILGEIAPKWKLFGRELGISSSKLESIEQPVTNEELLDKILDHWFDICDPVERVEDLCKSLVNIDKRKLANEVRQLASRYHTSLYPYNDVSVDDSEVTSEMQQVEESREATDEQDELSDRLERIRVSQNTCIPAPLNKTTNVMVQPNDNEGSVGGVGTSEQVTDNHPQEDPVKVGKPVNVVKPVNPVKPVINTATVTYHTNSHLPEESSFIPPQGSVIDNNTGCHQPVPPEGSVIDTHYTGHQQPGIYLQHPIVSPIMDKSMMSATSTSSHGDVSGISQADYGMENVQQYSKSEMETGSSLNLSRTYGTSARTDVGEEQYDMNFVVMKKINNN